MKEKTSLPAFICITAGTIPCIQLKLMLAYEKHQTQFLSLQGHGRFDKLSAWKNIWRYLCIHSAGRFLMLTADFHFSLNSATNWKSENSEWICSCGISDFVLIKRKNFILLHIIHAVHNLNAIYLRVLKDSPAGINDDPWFYEPRLNVSLDSLTCHSERWLKHSVAH